MKNKHTKVEKKSPIIERVLEGIKELARKDVKNNPKSNISYQYAIRDVLSLIVSEMRNEK